MARRTTLDPLRKSAGWLAAILVAALAGLAPHSAAACSCAQPTPEQAFERSTAVFAGRVVDIDTPFLAWLGLERSGSYDVTFAVSRRWKGVDRDSITVRTRLTGESCGYSFEMGGDYLVFVARGPAAGLETGMCSGTRDLAGAETELRALDGLADRAQ